MNAALFVGISLLSGFGGTTMSLVAGIWILDLTGSVSVAGLAGLCVYLPTLVAPWLGGLVDRLPRRALLISVNVLLTLALLTLPASVRSRDQVWLIFVVMLAYGISYVLLDAGESALLPAALPQSALGTVNGWRSSAQEGMKLVAPLAGAALYTWQGGGAVALLSAAMPLLAAVLYAFLRLDPARNAAAGPADAGRAELRDGRRVRNGLRVRDRVRDGLGVRDRLRVRDGLRMLWVRREVRAPVVVAAVAIGLSGFTVASVYARVTGGLGLPSAFLGVLAAAQGAGSIAAGLLVGRIVARRGETAVAATGALVFALGCLLWCLPWWPAMVAGSVAAGVGLPWSLVAAVTAVQTHTPAHMIGRVAATANTVMFGPIALTNPLGAAAVHLGARLPLVIAAGAAVTVAAAAIRRSRRRGAERPDRVRAADRG